MNQTPLQKSIAEIEAEIGEDHIALMCINILTANLEYERGEIKKASEYGHNVAIDGYGIEFSDYYTKTYEHERKD